MTARRLSDRDWVLATAVPMIAQIAERHGRDQDLCRLEVERLESDYVTRLTPQLVEGLVAVHGGARSPARLYAHLAAYLGRARGLGARYGATRARTSSLDESEGVVAVAEADDVADMLLSEAVERRADVQREAEMLYQQWLEDASERRRRQALTALRELLPDDGSVAAGTVWRRVEGYSPAEIASQDGVSENAINARLSRWFRQLSPAQREAFAPLRIVTPNPAKARGRRR